MNNLNYNIRRTKEALDFYKENLDKLEKYMEKEINTQAVGCTQLIRDGLYSLIINKKRELNSLENKSKEK
jgi:hypothetical protein